MKYEKEEYFEGDLAKVIDVAKNTFLPNGFEILNISNNPAKDTLVSLLSS